jgi:hypothetical protein
MPTLDSVMKKAERGRSLRDYKKGDTVKGSKGMSLQKGYSYTLDAAPGEDMDPKFKPVLTPAEIMFMGAFEGKYLNDCTDEFPAEWFLYAGSAGKLSPERPDVSCNYFGVPSRQPLSVWKENGWAPSRGRHVAETTGRAILGDVVKNPDERGWFQWYCRYWIGRRMPELDAVQIGRWRSFARHAGAVRKGCKAKDLSCRRRERQALLQWAYDPFI